MHAFEQIKMAWWEGGEEFGKVRISVIAESKTSKSLGCIKGMIAV